MGTTITGVVVRDVRMPTSRREPEWGLTVDIRGRDEATHRIHLEERM